MFRQMPLRDNERVLSAVMGMRQSLATNPFARDPR